MKTNPWWSKYMFITVSHPHISQRWMYCLFDYFEVNPVKSLSCMSHAAGHAPGLVCVVCCRLVGGVLKGIKFWNLRSKFMSSFLNEQIFIIFCNKSRENLEKIHEYYSRNPQIIKFVFPPYISTADKMIL